MFKIQLFPRELPGILPAGRRAGRADLAVLLLVCLSLACHTAAAQGNPYAMIGPVPMVEYAMPFERMPRLVNPDTAGDTAAMLIDGYGGKIYFVDASDSILGTAELPEDAVLMWLSVDPMTDKYPGISPYAYCLWNPVKLVDPDGRDIWLVNKGGERTKYSVGMSHEGFGVYTSRTIQALNKLADTKTMGNNIKQFTYNSSISVDIVESSDRTSSLARFSRGKQPVAHAAQEIEFNPYMGIEDVNTKEVMSPDACLGHEFGHIINVFDNTVNYHSRRLTKRDDVWDNEEEFYNIHTWEHGIISEWGELKREGHNSLDSDGNERYRVIDIRSREGIQFKE